MAQQPAPARRVALDLPQLRQQLAPAPGASARARQAAAYRISLPTLQGSRFFVLSESFVLPATDTAAQRRLRTFVGYEEGAPARRVSVVLTRQGLTADILAGSESASLRPAAGSSGYLLQPTPPTPLGECHALEVPGALLRPANFSTQPAPYSFGTQLRTIRYAVLVTQEFYTANGNNDAAVELAVATAINQMTGLYLQELSVSYQLVQPTGSPYYFSAMTTPTLAGSAAATAGSVRDQNLNDVSGIIGARFATGTYDLGHCYHNTGGGLAYVRIVCNSLLLYRAGAWSGVPSSGFRNVLAHEMGHQQGADHTFAGPCGSFGSGSQLEPGGGATIMSYSGVCAPQNLLYVTGTTDDDHFHARSLDQMRLHLSAVSCPTLAANANQVPTVNAGADYVIPRNTPFTLTATGTDPNGETLYYTWDQFDYSPSNLGALGTIVGNGGLAAINDPEAALFRPRPPRTGTSRTFPDLAYILANSNVPANLVGEALPNVGRDLHFTVTARDRRASGGTLASDNVTLTVAPGTGPFAVTTQNASSLWTGGQTATITWSVNGTDQAPIGVSQVRITLSVDGGQTFPLVLAAGTPNDGSETVAIPNVTTSRGRLRVEAVGNIFFDINDVDFPIGPCAPVASQILPATALSANAGDASLNLTQNAYSLIELSGPNQLQGTISATDPNTNLTDNTGSSCATYTNVQYYDSYVFIPSATATYTISTPTGFSNMVIRVYDSNGFVPSIPCQNVLANNFVPSVFLLRSVVVALTAGQPYTLVLSDFGSPTPMAPMAGGYSVAFSTSLAGGTAYAPLQSAGYEYQYAVVNTATDIVVRLAATADLRTLPAGTYDVYGLLFQRGYNVSGLRNSSLSSLRAALSSSAPCGQLSTNARRVTITGASPLPVVLTSFAGQAVGATNELRWQTASEQGVAYFEVQRSLDGGLFTGIGRVAATNGRLPHQYLLPDATPPVPLAYYRLLVQDADGSASYSPVVAVQRGVAAAAAFSVVAYPNPRPSGTSLQVQLQSPEAQTVQLMVTDIVGRPVWHQTLALPAGTTLRPLPEASQWHGVYLLRVQPNTGASQQQKIILE